MFPVVITPPRRIDLPSPRALWQSREVLYRFGKRDIVLRYRQTAIGALWVVIQPVVSAGVFAVVFGRVAQLPSQGVPYFLFSYAGMLCWNLFSNVVGRSSPSLIANQALVSKVFFPRLLVPISTVVSVLVDYLIAVAVGVVLLFVYGVHPGWAILLLPVWSLLVLMLALGIGIGAAAIQVKYRDIGYVLPWVIQVLLYASPVAYSLEAVPHSLHWLFAANPLTWYLEAFRWSFLGLDAPPLWQLIGTVVAAVVALLGGVLVFQRSERYFADVI